MSHRIVLTVDGLEYPLLTYSNNYFRTKLEGYNYSMVHPQVFGGLFYISLEATDNDELFYYWLKSGEMMNGSIEFFRTIDEDDIPFQRIDFWDAFLVRIKEQAAQGIVPMTMECDISAAIVRHNRNDATLLRKSWYVTDINEKPVDIYVSDAEEQEEKEPQCTLYFRRPKNYKGEFGFDWLRAGDTGEHGDVWYKDIIRGTVQDYDNFVAENYTHFNQQWKKEHPDYNKNYTYTVPWLTLMPGKTAELRLKLEVEEPAEKIDLRFANTADSQYLSLSLDNIPATQKGNYYHSGNLTITCNKPFSKNITLEAYAGDTLAGRLIVLKNDIITKVDIAVITVKTRSSGGVIVQKMLNIDMLNTLKTQLNQMYIDPNFINIGLDLSSPPPIVEVDVRKNKKQKVIKVPNRKGEVIARDPSFCTVPLIDLFFRNKDKKIHTQTKQGMDWYDNFWNFMNIMLHEEHKEIKDLLASCYKLYCFAEPGNSANGAILGQAKKEFKAAGIFISEGKKAEGGYNGDIPAHELYHVFSLGHTHSDTNNREQAFYFQENETDNIMSYQKVNAPIRFGLWYWQMQQVWQYLRMK